MAKNEGYIDFTNLHALILAFSVITYLADITLDAILAATYFSDGYYWYCFITVCLVFFPTLTVQIFSARWHIMDEVMDKATWILHTAFLGVLHRYLVVISLGYEALKTQTALDYQRFYQQQSDVCMLRLFDSFLESAPQLVFHLYVMLARRSEWTDEQAAWTGMSAIISMVSLGWGIAAYSSAMRMVNTEKRRMTWIGMILQTIWRFGMLSARIVALVLLTHAIHEWVIIIMFVHWLLMTLWVIFQDTDFCSNVWEERLYNAVVGVIYCFCFFNLKEGRSRYRAAIFYVVIILENYACLAVFSYLSDYQDARAKQTLTIGAIVIVSIGTMVGLSAMMLYYRFFHPVGPINVCGSIEVEEEKKKEESQYSPDFEIQDDNKTPQKSKDDSSTPSRPPRKSRVQYSRSFKDSCPRDKRFTPRRRNNNSSLPGSPDSVDTELKTVPAHLMHQEKQDSAYGTDSNRTASRSTASPHLASPREDPNRSGSSLANKSSSSSQAFNNETYMSIDSPEQGKKTKMPDPNSTYVSVKSGGASSADVTSEFSQCSQTSAESRITVVEKSQFQKRKQMNKTPVKIESEGQQPEQLLKRSPVLKDVTATREDRGRRVIVQNGDEYATPSKKNKKKGEGLTAPLTIIIPNISHQAFARSNSSSNATVVDERKKTHSAKSKEALASHDYENLALININRGPVGVSHWRTYSDMANDRHDESIPYERKKPPVNVTKNSDYSNYGSLQYYDIYPLSKEIKEQLYRSITPVSTAATVATSSSDSKSNITDSDTYEPIEAFDGVFAHPAGAKSAGVEEGANPLPVTLIHHDGEKMMTKQVVSLENLRDMLQNHNALPMDDPQERGDLYLLAPMRLLTPIIEESETNDTTRNTESTVYNNVGQELNRSILTVISEMLGSANGNYAHARQRSVSKAKPFVSDLPEGPFPDSIESTSSLVHTIDEVRNNSLCNLFFSSFNDLSSSLNSTLKSSGDAAPAPQVPPRNSVNTTNPSKPSAKATDSSVESNKSPAEEDVKTEHPPVLPEKQQTTPLLSSRAVGSRKNILELAGTANTILNTPKRPSKQQSQSLSLPQPTSQLPQQQPQPAQIPLPKHIQHPPLQDNALPKHIQHPPLQENALPKHQTVGLPLVSSSSTSTSTSILERLKNDSLFQNRNESTPISNTHNASGLSLRTTPLTTMHSNSESMRIMNLSPSSKYETPTPPLKANQFVRGFNSRQAVRRKFSMIREKFEPHDGALSGSNQDLYQNISDNDLLHNDLSQISAKSISTPSFLDSRHFGLRPDEKYENLQRGWATSSIRDPLGAFPQRRNEPNRRSMSAIDDHIDKENYEPEPPALGPKPKKPVTKASRLIPNELQNHSKSPLKSILTPPGARSYRVTSSLSPQSKIFAAKSTNQV